MKYESIIKYCLLSLFLCSGFSLKAQTPLQNEAVRLISAARYADDYWASLQHHTSKHLFQVAPWQWFSASWSKKTKNKRESLKKTQQDLAVLLGKIVTAQQQPTKEYLQSTINRARTTIKAYKTPGHASRNWFKYACTIGGIAGAYFWLQKTFKEDLLFIVDGPCVRHLLEGNKKHLPYHYTTNGGHQYIRIEKQNAAQLKTLLNDNKDITFTTRTPLTQDSHLYLYNEDGENLVKKFYEEHGVEPVRGIKKILFNEVPHEYMLSHDLDYSKKKFVTDLDELIIRANKLPRTKPLVVKHTQNKPLNDVPLSSKRNILNDLIALAHKEIPQECSKVKMFKTENNESRIPLLGKIETLIDSGNKGAEIIEYLIQENADFFALSFEALFLHVIERDLQASVLMNKINDVSEKLKLNIEFVAIIPAMIATYAAYKLLTKVVSKVTGIHILTPLKKDLIRFQLMLNKERCTPVHKSSLAHKGMCYYWIAQLENYMHRIPRASRTLYANYLEQLKDSQATPTQKITVIECMFREFAFLR